MKIRIMGSSEEIEKALENLEKNFSIFEVSDYYKNRGNSKYYRCYVECVPRKQTKIPDDKIEEFLAVVDRAERDSDWPCDNQTAYLKAIRATLLALDYDQDGTYNEFRNKQESYFENR